MRGTISAPIQTELALAGVPLVPTRNYQLPLWPRTRLLKALLTAESLAHGRRLRPPALRLDSCAAQRSISCVPKRLKRIIDGNIKRCSHAPEMNSVAARRRHQDL